MMTSQIRKIWITSEILISRPWYLREKCLDFSVLSNGINCFWIWGDQIFIDRTAGGWNWGSSPDPPGHVQKMCRVDFLSKYIYNSETKVKFKLTRRYNKLLQIPWIFPHFHTLALIFSSHALDVFYCISYYMV